MVADHKVGLEDDNEISKIVQAARLRAEDALSQKDIARRMNVSTSTVSRWLDKAAEGKEDKILQLKVTPPRYRQMEEVFLKILKPKGVPNVTIVPSGPGRNVRNLGDAGADRVLEAILAVSSTTPSDRPIRIVLSCGTTVTEVIKDLIDRLDKQQLSAAPIRHNFEIYPSTLYGDSKIDPIYPHTIVASLGILGGEKLPEKMITAYAPQVPENFYEKSPTERRKYREEWGGLNTFEDNVKKGDIFVLGAGTIANASYAKIIKELRIDIESIKDEMPPLPQVLYIPIHKNGKQHAEIAEKIVGLKVNDIRDISHKPNKHVIVIAGGSEKVESLQTLIEFPCYNTLVTDSTTAMEAIRIMKAGSAEPIGVALGGDGRRAEEARQRRRQR